MKESKNKNEIYIRGYFETRSLRNVAKAPFFLRSR